MTQLTSIIQHNNLDDKLIVFSVPSFFTEIEKKAFLNAAEISGLKNVKLVTEAVAIGMDYGSCKKS
jgi:molecular chaperone DnaK (HSP70)